MPFTEKTHVLHAVDCSHATDSDRVRVALSDGSAVVLRTMPELADGLERAGHVRLHLDKQLTDEMIVKGLEHQAFPSLIHYLRRKLKQHAEPSMINFFCWADNYELWAGEGGAYYRNGFEFVGWLQIPGEPENYFPTGPFRLEASLVSVEFFTV